LFVIPSLKAQMTICSKNVRGHGPLDPLAAPVPAGKGADMSELQALHCMTPEQWTWPCAVWVSYLQINCYCKN